MSSVSLHSDRLRLRGAELATHFAAPLFFVMIGLVTAALLVFGDTSPDRAVAPRYFMGGALIIGWLSGWIQYRALNFKIIQTASDAITNFDRVLAEAKKSDWQIVSETSAERIVALTHPEITWGGERVEVKFRGPNVLVNSICNPQERGAMDFFALNARYRNVVRRAVTQNGHI